MKRLTAKLVFMGSQGKLFFLLIFTINKLVNQITQITGAHISGVGKSSIITRYIKGDYKKECEATIGASFMYAKVTIRDYQITLKVILIHKKKKKIVKYFI